MANVIRILADMFKFAYLQYGVIYYYLLGVTIFGVMFNIFERIRKV